MKVLKAGTEITCPKCNRVMARLKDDLMSVEIIKSELFEQVDGNIQKHLPMECPFDGEPYGITSMEAARIHTKKDSWQ